MSIRLALPVLALAISAVSCTPGPGQAPATPRPLWSLEGFSTPESMQHDAARDWYFVTNIAGNPAARDGNGFISRLSVDGKLDSLHFVAGGRNNVTLNAPKGLVVVGDTLWVADLDAVRAFDARTGAALAAVDLAGLGAKFLNDLTVGADGALYVTDTGILIDAQGAISHPGPDRIFRVAGGKASVLAEGDAFRLPNGIVWDAVGRRFIVAPFGGDSILALKAGETVPTAIGAGAGQLDGVEMLDERRIIFSSWADSSVNALLLGATTRLMGGLTSPADIGLDRRRRRVLVPLFQKDRVEVWELR